jgi:asparagine synthase (glutamine-hydrolysing)
VCKDLGRDVTLLTIGFPTSPDIRHAPTIAREMTLPHLVKVLSSDRLATDIRLVCSLAHPASLVDLELTLAVYHLAQLATEAGIQVMLTAAGLDELFCGYDSFRRALSKGVSEVHTLMRSEIQRALTCKRLQDKIAQAVGVRKVDPFLTPQFIGWAMDLPIDLKIRGAEDRMRKHILRDVALQVGVPASAALRPKKALQYSTGIHRQMVKLARQSVTRAKARRLGFTSPLQAWLAQVLK